MHNRPAVVTFTFCSLILSGYVCAAPPTPVVGQLVDEIRLRGTEDIFLQGDYAYLPCREGKRLTVCSIKDPAHPAVVSSFTHPLLGEAAGFAMQGNRIYVTSMSSHRLLILDASDKKSIRLLRSVPVGEKGALYKAAYRDGFCFIPNLHEKKLFIVDVRNSKQPRVIGSVIVTTGNDGPFSVTLHGDYAYVGTIFGKQNRLAVVDIKVPAQPRLVTQILGPDMGHASGQIAGQNFYAVNWDRNAFFVFDLTNPAAPELQAKLLDRRLGKPNRCVVEGNRAYLPMVEGDGIAVVDLSNPAQPAFLTAYHDSKLLKKTYGVAVRGSLLYVASREGNSLVVLNREMLERK